MVKIQRDGLRLNTNAIRQLSTGSSYKGSSGQGSSRISSRARVSLNDTPFVGRKDGAVNVFPNPLFECSNASFASARSEPDSARARQHAATSSAVRFARTHEADRGRASVDDMSNQGKNHWHAAFDQIRYRR